MQKSTCSLPSRRSNVKKSPRRPPNPLSHPLPVLHLKKNEPRLHYPLSIALYQKSIDQASPGAKSNLGYLYLMGEDVAKDFPRAMKLFQEAVNENDIAGMINLAVMQFNGMGCDRDPKAAFSLLEKAVALGSGQAGALLRSWKVEEAERMK